MLVNDNFVELLSGAGFRPAKDAVRGFDHGVFVPFMLIAPEANIPVVQLSLIEYTLRHTALDTLGEGDDVHVEADMMGKYVQKMLGAYRSLAPDT